jgi:hypothetical protein
MKNIMIVLGLVLLIGLGYFFGQYHNPNSGQKAVDYQLIGEAQDCDLSERACSVDDYSLEFFDRPVLALKPVRVELRTSREVRSVILDLEMLDMDMGINRFALKKTRQDTWTGTVMIPVCATGRRDWRVNMLLVTPEGARKAIYSFVVQ